ncbi:MAG: hypothetical protein V4569_16630 [Pseudomonadota bacterium]
MQTKAEQRQALIRLYCEEHATVSWEMHDVAEWAIKTHGVIPPTPKTPTALLAELLSAAAREESGKDEVTGRPYRVNLAVTTWVGGEQMTLWHTLNDAPRPVAHKGLKQRREQVVGDVVSIADDQDHWNRLHPADEPIQLPFDFELDVLLARHAPPDEDEKVA